MPSEDKYDADFQALEEASRWLNHINLRRHRGNETVRTHVKDARAAVASSYNALLEVERAELERGF